MNNMRILSCFILVTSASLVAGQRPFFAGFRPIGYPELPNRTTTESLENRFGEGTTERLPLEANGDRDLVDRISKLPVDKQPFWFLNWQALEANRKNPQSYPLRPNVFLESASNIGNSDATTLSSSSNAPTSNTGLSSNSASPSFNGNSGSTPVVLNPNSASTANRFGSSDPAVPNSNSTSHVNEFALGDYGVLNSNSTSTANRFGSNDPAVPNTNPTSDVNKFELGDYGVLNSNSASTADRLGSGIPNSGNSNSENSNVNLNSNGSELKKYNVQQNSNTQEQIPIKKIENYYPQGSRGGYGLY